MESLPPESSGPPPGSPPGPLPAEEPSEVTAEDTTGPDEAAEADETTAEAAAAPARTRPRGRTALIVACAALLGVVAGVATGYTVQADRKPTPLPPLSGPKLSYPKERLSADEYEPLPAKHDRRVKTDGDLRKLLVDKPAGARESPFHPSEASLVPVDDFAQQYTDPTGRFQHLLSEDVRRIAHIGWDDSSEHTTVVSLIQFRSNVSHAAREYVELQQALSTEDPTGASGERIKGSGNGFTYVPDSPDREPGYLPLYRARAIAYRGDIVMDIEIFGTRPVSEKDIRELAEQQMERL
jgi:hypothetical protein